jgi:hypothetical protein
VLFLSGFGTVKNCVDDIGRVIDATDIVIQRSR